MSKVFLNVTLSIVVDTDLTDLIDIMDNIDIDVLGDVENVNVLSHEVEMSGTFVVDAK